VVGLLRREGEVLLCHRLPGRTYYPNVWDLPGGHVDTDESLRDALVRELEEELGIRINPPAGPPWTTLRTATIELHIFIVDQWEDEPHNLAPDEHDEIRWFVPEALDGLALADSSYVTLLREAMGDSGRQGK
jgi:8-oxo-dGTP pyrophosphatase MutT (NUDIX family)